MGNARFPRCSQNSKEILARLTRMSDSDREKEKLPEDDSKFEKTLKKMLETSPRTKKPTGNTADLRKKPGN